MLYRGTMEVIPNGMPDHVFVPDAPPDIKGSKLTFATILVGWGGYKNGRVAIEAFARLRKRYTDARLVMFGSAHGPGEQAEQWARARGMEQGIEFVGQLPYDVLMTRLAAEVDILIHPSLEESQSLALVEAMALKIPVIGGTPCGAVPWTLDSGRAGLLVDVRSPEQIVQAMAQLAAQPALRRELGERGQQNAFRRFHISTMTDAYQSVYAQLAEGG
jgi:glycosyltransferase involved in cell wall biosynthesis